MNGKLIKKARINSGKTLEQLAGEVGCSVRTLQRYEADSIEDSNACYILIRLCKALHLPIVDALCAYDTDRRTREKEYEEILQILNCMNFSEWQYYYNLARKNCIADSDYYFIFDVTKRHEAMTEWIGYDESLNEIRKPRIVKPKEMIDLSRRLYGDPIIINDDSDVFLFQIFGGYALIKKELYDQYFYDFLK